jgi:hypothetical protein
MAALCWLDLSASGTGEDERGRRSLKTADEVTLRCEIKAKVDLKGSICDSKGMRGDKHEVASPLEQRSIVQTPHPEKVAAPHCCKMHAPHHLRHVQ